MRGASGLWLQGAALQQKCHNSAVSVPPRHSQSSIIARVNVRTSVKEEPGRLQLAAFSSCTKGLLILRMEISTVIQQELNHLQASADSCANYWHVHLSVNIRAPVEEERRGVLVAFLGCIHERISVLGMNVRSAVQEQSHHGRMTVIRRILQRLFTPASAPIQQKTDGLKMSVSGGHDKSTHAKSRSCA